jgi:hypothetical protein
VAVVEAAGGGAGKASNKTIHSLEKRVQEHQRKLDAYRADPDKFDNKGFLKNAPTPEIRNNIIESRIRHLESEIRTFQNQIDNLKGNK